MPDPLADRLHAVLELLQAGRLPGAALEALTAAVEAPAVRRAVRNDRIIRLAADLGGPGAVYEAISGEAWRWALWETRGIPQRATPAERLAFEAWAAGPAVSRRQVERILRHRTGAQCRGAPAMLQAVTTNRTA